MKYRETAAKIISNKDTALLKFSEELQSPKGYLPALCKAARQQ